MQEGKERMIAATERKTTQYERNYPSHKGELSAIIYGLKGKKNQAADAMSRCDHLPLPTKEEEAEQAEYINNLKMIDGVVHTLSKELTVREQKTDDTLSTVRGWMINGPPTKDELKGQS